MNKNIRKITEGAVLLALAVVLSFITVYKLPNGGSITAGSLIPIIVFSLRHNIKWGLLVSVTYSVLQMLLGFYAPPAGDLLSYILMILLDYVLCFGVLGLAGGIYRLFKNKPTGAIVATVSVIILKFISNFLSGIILWGSLAPEGQSVWLYSFLYNASYNFIELIISTVIIGIMAFTMQKILFEDKR